MKNATFYHAGCPVCVSAEHAVAMSLDPAKVKVDIIHLGKDKSRLTQAKAQGVKSVPALVMDDTVYHINFGASISDLG